VPRPRGLLSDEARSQITSAIAALEQRSAAEVVVAVHPRSGRYRQAEWALSVSLAVTWLLLFLYHPVSFDFTWLPLELVAVGLVGLALARGHQSLKRALVLSRTLAREVDRSAKEAFVDLGISRTRARTGVLVFVSLLEGQARVLSDIGVPKLALPALLTSKLQEAARRNDVNGLVDALRSLEPSLARELPRAADDENELADGPVQVKS